MSKLKNKYLYLFIFFLLIYVFIFFQIKKPTVFFGDAVGYYQYFSNFFSYENILPKYPIGTVIFELPFLILALIFSSIFNIDIQNGYASIFQCAINFAAFFYGGLTLSLIFKICSKKYDKICSFLTCICIAFLTPFLYYVIYFPGYSHIYGLFINTLFFYFVNYFENKKNNNNFKSNFILGLILGLCCLIRFSNIIIYSLYIFYNVNSLNDFSKKLKNIFTNKILYQILGFILIFAIQIMYWKIIGGVFFFNGYSDENFDNIANPQIINVLFSCAKGLFIYSPILFAAFVGMFFLNKNNNEFKISQWIIFIFQTLIISAWWCWWLGYGYSERLYCDILFIFVLPLTAVFYEIKTFISQTKHKYKKPILFLLFLSITILSLLSVIWLYGIDNNIIQLNFGNCYELQDSILKFFNLY